MIVETAIVLVPAALEPRWKYTTLTLTSAVLWALSRGSRMETSTVALLVANGIMYRIITAKTGGGINPIPQNISDWYWHVFLPLLAVTLYKLIPCEQTQWDYTIPVAYATMYGALLITGVLRHYDAFQNAKPAMKVAFCAVYFALVLTSVWLLKR